MVHFWDLLKWRGEGGADLGISLKWQHKDIIEKSRRDLSAFDVCPENFIFVFLLRKQKPPMDGFSKSDLIFPFREASAKGRSHAMNQSRIADLSF